MMRDRPETEADLGTLQPVGVLGFSGVSSWWVMRREAPLRYDGLVPVLLLRRRMRRRLETTPSVVGSEVESVSTNIWVLSLRNFKKKVFASLTLFLCGDG